ncbi:MAG: methyltransferase domain-containing protein [Burkholderiaceae bacterium]
MTSGNTQQIAEWNGSMGRQWAALQSDLDKVVAPFGAAALRAAAARAGERVIDIGCGCGDTTMELARIVGAQGAVLGVDVSQPMLEVARARAQRVGHRHIAFLEADASQSELPAGQDLLYSRFGVMFFEHPDAAFVHMRKSLRPGGRLAFVCWRAPRDNPWAMAPLMAARKAMGVTPAPADPDAPGPFAFADEQRVRAILSGVGFSDIGMERFDATISLGASPRAAAERAVSFGPAARFVKEAGIQHLDTIRDAIENSLAALATPDGSVCLAGSTWVVTASSAG